MATLTDNLQQHGTVVNVRYVYGVWMLLVLNVATGAQVAEAFHNVHEIAAWCERRGWRMRILPALTGREGTVTGFKNVAQRAHNARERFLSFAMETADLTRDEALRALAVLRKARVLELDAVDGQFRFKHGAFAERQVLRRAAGADGL